MLVELPTAQAYGSLWVNPAHVVSVRLADFGRCWLVTTSGVEYTIQLAPEQVAQLLQGQPV